MGRGSGVCKFLELILIFSLLVNGVCAAESTDISSNGMIKEIDGSINGTIYDETNNVAIGVINGTINIIPDDTIDDTIRNTQMFSWVLLLPIFFGSLLFLGWVCRYFPEMTSCFVLFMLLLLLAVILLIGFTRNSLVFLLTPLLLLPLLYELYNEIREIDHNNRKINFILVVLAVMLLIGFIKKNLVLLLILSLLLLLVYVDYTEKREKEKKEGNKRKKEIDDRSTENNLLYKAKGINIIGTVLIWPLILVYFYYHNIQYVTFYGIEDLSFPVYIIPASLIGVTSYILLSIEDTFSHLVPEYRKLSAVWSYLKRFLIAPFIAIVGFYLLNYLQNINRVEDVNINDSFVFVFSFFAGVFTKTIEEWIYSWVQKLLPEKSKKDLDSRNLSEVKESDFVKKLGFDEDVAYKLYKAKIRTIDELAVCEDEKLFRKLKVEEEDLSAGESYYSRKSIIMYKKKAQNYIINKSKLVAELEELSGHLEEEIKNFNKKTEELKLKEIIQGFEDKENKINPNSTDPTIINKINPNSTDPAPRNISNSTDPANKNTPHSADPAD